MNDTEELLELELVLLEGGPKCEFTHGKGNPPCTVTAIATVSDCSSVYLACDNARKMVLTWMEIGGRCAGCKRYSADCWKVRPL